MRKFLTLLVMVMCTTLTMAQNKTVTGKVTDEKGAPVANASVLVKGTTKGVTTNNDGSFSISVPTTAKTLVISSVNFTPQEANVTKSSSLLITLLSTSSSLEEVVVVGYGSGKKRSDLVGSVTTVGGEKVQERPSANALDALQGRVAGLQVYTSNGEPSATSSIRLNGTGSLTAGSTPLFVLDGIPVAQGSIISLNAEDYESITVLRDASATSIYGSRAANGVIYFTSKKGKVNSSVISLQSQYAVSSLVGTTQKFFDSFMNSSELLEYQVQTGVRTRASADALLATGINTKWSDVYYKSSAPTYSTNLSVSGGGGKTTYYVSGSYFNQDGLAFRSGFKRYTLRSNVNSVVNNWLTLGMNLVGGFDQRQTNPYGTNSTNRGLGLLAQPFYTPKNPTTGANYELIPGWGRYHPEYLAEKVRFNGDNVQINPSGYIQISPIKNLVFKTQAGLEAYDYTTTSIQLPSYLQSLNNGSVAETYDREVTKTLTNTLEYKFSLANRHNIVALLGNESIENKIKSFNGSSTGQTDDRLLLISSGPSNRNAGSSSSEYAYLSYFGRINYDLDKKYYFDLSLRQDQSSRFGKDNREANFWSVGARWNAKRESFLENVNWLSDLVVRASIGTSGNSAIGNYDNLALVGTNQYDGASGFGLAASGNPELSWEQQKMTTVGINVSLFKRLNIEAEYYEKLTTNMLLSVPYPLTSGFANVQTNVGGLKNSGINITINGDVLRSRKAYITPYVNFNYNNEKIVELFQGRNYYILPNTGVSWAVGQPVSYFYPVFSGINSQNGLPEWYLPNSDPNMIVNPQTDKSKVTSTFNTAALQQNTGIRRYPPFTGGFGFASGYDGFYFNADFSFAQGKYLINNDRYFFENPNQFTGFNQARNIYDYWKQAGDVTRYPRYGQQFTQFDSRLIENASFMRLKNITVGYNVPKKLLKKTNFISNAKFFITGRNLWTLTNYTGPDPEVDSNLTLGVNPNTKQIAFGFDIQF